MTDENQKPKLELVPPTEEELDEEEREFRALRRDLPGVKGASAAGIVAISVGKAPTKNDSSVVTRSSVRSFRWSTARWVWNANTLR